MNRMMSLMARIERDFSVTAKSRPSLSSFTPPVSTRVTGWLPNSQRSGIGSLVTPGVGSVMALRLPMSLLNSVDFPTLGLPTIEIRGRSVSISALFLISSFSIISFSFYQKGYAPLNTIPFQVKIPTLGEKNKNTLHSLPKDTFILQSNIWKTGTTGKSHPSDISLYYT